MLRVVPSLHRGSLLSERAADAILELILERRLQPGDALPASGELARDFDVSAIVIRQAIATLAGRGILVRRQGREATVARPGPDVLDSLLRVRMHQDAIALEELQQCRAALEGQAAVLACRVGDPEQRRTALGPSLEAMQRANEIDELRTADVEFHTALARLAGNQALTLLLEAMNSAVSDSLDDLYRRLLASSGSTLFELTRSTHQAIGDAVAAGDAAGAAAAMSEHFRASIAGVDYGLLGDDVLAAGSQRTAG
jgi:DNA-binding FadR family transcriptional regulator